MDTKKKSNTIKTESQIEDGEAIEKGFEQMEMIYRSRCIQPPHGKNVTVREIDKDGNTKKE